MAVSTKSVSEIISKLECEKSAGLEGIDAEYLKFLHKSRVTQKHYQKLHNLVRFVVYLHTCCLKKITNYVYIYIYIYIEREIIIWHLPPKKFDKVYKLASSVVLLKKFAS